MFAVSNVDSSHNIRRVFALHLSASINGHNSHKVSLIFAVSYVDSSHNTRRIFALCLSTDTTHTRCPSCLPCRKLIAHTTHVVSLPRRIFAASYVFLIHG